MKQSLPSKIVKIVKIRRQACLNAHLDPRQARGYHVRIRVFPPTEVQRTKSLEAGFAQIDV